MFPSLKQFRLSHLPLAPRVAMTGFLALAGIGYLVSVSYMYASYQGVDGKPGMSPNDVKQHLHGKRDATLLEAKLNGTMKPFLPEGPERNAVLKWVHQGAPEAGFAAVQPVFKAKCVSCHQTGSQAAFRPLTDFKEVAATVKTDTGEAPETWMRVAHIHLQSISFTLLALGLLFSFTGLPEKLKAVVVGVPFVALVADFGTRALARLYPEMVFGVMLSGMLLGLCMGAMILGSLWELWFAGRTRTTAAPSLGDAVPEPA